MSGYISNYFANVLLGHVFNKTTLTPLTSIYVALSTSDPGLDGSTITEPTGSGYSRVQISTANLLLSNRVIYIDTRFVFPISSATWGTITHIAVFDSLTGGNFLGSSSLSTPYTINSGVIFGFNPNMLNFSL